MTVGMSPQVGQSEVRGGRFGRLEHPIVAAPRQRDAVEEIRRHQRPHNLEQILKRSAAGTFSKVSERWRPSWRHSTRQASPVRFFWAWTLATAQKVPLNCAFLVELTGPEPVTPHSQDQAECVTRHAKPKMGQPI